MKPPLVLFISLFYLTGCGPREFIQRSTSMDPTIPEGSIVLGDMNAYRDSEPKRFDLILFTPPIEDGGDSVFIFRIIGLPGEKIDVTNDGILINNESITKPEGISYSPTRSGNISEILGDDEFFVLGDNTELANDSRHWGPVPRRNILGKVTDIQPAGADNPD